MCNLKAIVLYKHVIEEMSIMVDLKMIPKISRDIYCLKKNSLHSYAAYIAVTFSAMRKSQAHSKLLDRIINIRVSISHLR